MERMYCNNCGKRGHVFKSCLDPITSCGIILINQPSLPTTPKDARILMVRRKDSMAYTEFLRGKYSPDELDYVRTLLSNMTKNEHDKLSCLSFDDLWTLHWGVGHDHHSHEFEVSKKRFEQLDMNALVSNIRGYPETEWGFPKGRRHNRESDMDCAIREFSEETNIPRSSYIACRNIVLTETFAGTNGIQYKHIYFIAILKDPHAIDLQQTMTTMQKREVSGIEWKTIEECRDLTRPHYIQRPALLNSFESIIQSFDVQDNVVFKQE